MADIEDSDWVSVIERLALVFCVQFHCPGYRRGVLSIEYLALFMAKRGRRLQLGYSKAYSANRHE